MRQIVMGEAEIKETYQRVGEELTEALKNEKKRPVFLCIMKGAMTFLEGILPYVKVPVIVDYIHLSSYEGTSTTGEVKMLKAPTFNPDGRTLVIVEDCVDTGLSMKALKEYLEKTYHPSRVLIAVFVDKRARRQYPIHLDFVGKVMEEDRYIVGNGFDYNEIGRNIPYVFTPSEEDFAKWDEMLKEDPIQKN